VVHIGAVADNSIVTDGYSRGDKNIIGELGPFPNDYIAIVNREPVKNIFVGPVGENVASGAHSTFFLQVYKSGWVNGGGGEDMH
jgi:hypothetical protein